MPESSVSQSEAWVDESMQRMYAQNVLDKPDNWTYEPVRDVYVQIAHTDDGRAVAMVVPGTRVAAHRRQRG